MDRGDPLLSISEAAQCLRAGAVIAYPTEAVYGLGCDPDSESAVRRILELKKRPAAAGLILIADSFDRLGRYVARVPRDLLDRALDTWPGHVTWLFPRADGVPDWLAGDHPTIAIRVTAHPVSRDLCAAFAGALVSTSANPRSEDPAQSVSSVRRYFGDDIAGVVAGQLGGDPRPSEIRDLATGRVIRGG